MPHGPEHHIEEAEHAEHSAHNPFDRRVALTVAIVAAMLACVTMFSHRAHNLTLQNQIKSNDSITERANRFAYYHFKKNRQQTDERAARLLEAIAAGSNDSAVKENARKQIEQWTGNVKKWKEDVKDLQEKASALNPKIKEYADEAHKYHHRADFFDYGELGVELALVLCSISLLTKTRGFWFAGMAAAAIGFAVAMSAFVVPTAEEHHEEGEESLARLEAGGGPFRLRAASASAGLDKRIDAQSHENGAQQRHRRHADAAHAFDLALANQGHDQPAAGSEKTE